MKSAELGFSSGTGDVNESSANTVRICFIKYDVYGLDIWGFLNVL